DFDQLVPLEEARRLHQRFSAGPFSRSGRSGAIDQAYRDALRDGIPVRSDDPLLRDGYMRNPFEPRRAVDGRNQTVFTPEELAARSRAHRRMRQPAGYDDAT